MVIKYSINTLLPYLVPGASDINSRIRALHEVSSYQLYILCVKAQIAELSDCDFARHGNEPYYAKLVAGDSPGFTAISKRFHFSDISSLS